MTDAPLVLRKLSLLLEHVKRARRRSSIDPETFRADLDRQDAAALSFLVAVQEAVDIALHLAATEGWGVPASYGDAFDTLARQGALEVSHAQLLRQAVAVRNRLAHGYASVDIDRLWRELPAGLDTLERFAEVIARRCGPPVEP
jgi:uncharacterized protein YutE (UPF0331/DUF86 family)